MWLLNVETARLEQVSNERTDSGPEGKPYAILSHRWLSDIEQEISYDDIRSDVASQPRRSKAWPLRRHTVPAYKQKQGYRKVRFACQQAQQQNLKYVWIDTCCINKRDESETAEAIRSMYNWYRRASICYAYLADVFAERLTVTDRPTVAKHLADIGRQQAEADSFKSDWRIQFETSSWFRRGWTLQELLAPRVVNFYNADWDFIGTLEDLAHAIAEVTCIPRSCLTRYVERSGLSLCDYSYAQRLSWAGKRETTRGEDRTYSLMGIFGLHMQVLYGEGSKAAFRRQQEELFRRSADQSLLAWTGPSGGLLSPSIDYFQNCDKIIDIAGTSRTSACVLDDKQYRTFLRVVSLKPLTGQKALDLRLTVGASHMALLNCRYADDPVNGPALCLNQLSRRERNGDVRFHVIGETRRIERCPLGWFSEVKPQYISIVRGSEKRAKGMQLRLRSQVPGHRLEVVSYRPQNGWTRGTNDGHDPNDTFYNFWPRAPSIIWYTAAVTLRVVTDYDTIHVGLVTKYNRQGDDTRIVHLARGSESSSAGLYNSFSCDDSPPTSSSPPDLAISGSCQLRVVSLRGKVKITLVER